ncbi:MAG: rhodanese-like domain-containing protein [Lachnospiraceae bacterium]
MRLNIISADELDPYIERGNCMLIDVRRPSEFRMEHIKGAINFPYSTFEDWMYQLPKYVPIILYCERGGASLDLCKKLCRAGYDAITVNGGIIAYRGKYLITS